jgi:hypothetical protein
MGHKTAPTLGSGGWAGKVGAVCLGAKTNTGRDFLCELAHTAWGKVMMVFSHVGISPPWLAPSWLSSEIGQARVRKS